MEIPVGHIVISKCIISAMRLISQLTHPHGTVIWDLEPAGILTQEDAMQVPVFHVVFVRNPYSVVNRKGARSSSLLFRNGINMEQNRETAEMENTQEQEEVVLHVHRHLFQEGLAWMMATRSTQ